MAKVCNWRCVGCAAIHAISSPVYVVGIVSATCCLYTCSICNACGNGYDSDKLYDNIQLVSTAIIVSVEGSLFYDPTKMDWMGAPIRQKM